MSSYPETDAALQVKLWLGAKEDWLEGNAPRDAEMCKTGNKRKRETIYFIARRLTSLMTFSLTVLAAEWHGFLPLELSVLLMMDSTGKWFTWNMLLSLQTGALCWARGRKRRKVSTLCKLRAVSSVGPWALITNHPLSPITLAQNVSHLTVCRTASRWIFLHRSSTEYCGRKAGSANTHQHCREAVTSAFPRPFLHCITSDDGLLHFPGF